MNKISRISLEIEICNKRTLLAFLHLFTSQFQIWNYQGNFYILEQRQQTHTAFIRMLSFLSHEMVFKTREFEIHNILIHIQFHLKKITNCSDFIVSKKITE